ncbi:MAG TPA: hypothetical protein VK614_04950 [Allosphingosinicella sp.]|nr:hypothetical protein [Allosphingosinicella sp.]
MLPKENPQQRDEQEDTDSLQYRAESDEEDGSQPTPPAAARYRRAERHAFAHEPD